MTEHSDTQIIEMIPIDRVTVINPRVRNKRVFAEIVSNISEIGLKRPITVTRRNDPDGERYDLVCGQGRLEAYHALGQREIHWRAVRVRGRAMPLDKPPICMNCDRPMSFTLRISLPPQAVYRCETCKVEAWVPEPKNFETTPDPQPAQQQQQPQPKQDADK